MSKELKQVSSNRWETESGDWIWKDDFSNFIIKAGGIQEITNTFEKAVRILNHLAK